MKFVNAMAVGGVSIALVLAGAVFSGTVHAGDGKSWKRTKETQVHAERGTYMGSKTTERGKGWRSTSGSATGPGGKTVTTERAQSWGKTEHGAQSGGGGMRTFNDGSSSSRSWQKELNHDTQTRTKSAEKTFRDGTSVSGSSEVTKTGAGQYDYNKAYTDRSGEEHSASGSVTITKN